MVKTPNFRRTPASGAGMQAQPAVIPPEIAAHAPQLPANVPLPRSQPVMSEYTRRGLIALGWKDGDPIPGDLGARIKEIQDSYAKDRETAKHDVPSDYKPPEYKLVQIADLPADKQAELRQCLADYKTQVSQEAVVAQQRAAQESLINPEAPPSVQEAQRVAMQAANSFGFVNDVPPGGVPAMPVPDGKVLGGVSGLSPAIQKLEQAKQQRAASPPAAAEPSTAPALPGTGAVPELTNCPRCSWDLKAAFTLEATDDDKMVYRAALLGSGRFTKDISLLDGDLVIRYRSLTVSEVRMLREQMRYDVQNGKVLGDGEFMVELWEYRLVMCVSQVRRGPAIIDIPAIGEIPYDPPKLNDPPETALVHMRQWFYDNVATTEMMANLLREHQRQFNRLTEYLETMSQEPNFFRGIATGR